MNERTSTFILSIGRATQELQALRHNKLGNWYTGNPDNLNNEAVKKLCLKIDTVLKLLETDNFWEDLNNVE